MKKLALTIVCAVAVTGSALAQGTLGWNLISPAAMTARTNSTTYSPLFGGASTGLGAGVGGGNVGSTGSATTSGFHYYYELLYTGYSGSQLADPTSVSSLFTWSDSGLEATNSSTASFLVPVNGSAGASVNGWAAGTTNSIMLVGWSSNLGTTWASVSNYLANWSTLGSSVVGNAYFGESVTGYINPNTSPAAGPTLFNGTATANGLPINSLNTPLYLLPVPEPTTIALAGLGGLSLLLFRRRKV